MELSTILKTESNQICRICLIKSECTNNLNFNMYKYCTGIDVSEILHSTQICTNCESSLNGFSVFKEKCVESHDSIIRMYSDSKTNENSVDQLLEVKDKVEEDEELFPALVVCDAIDNEIEDKIGDEIDNYSSESESTKKLEEQLEEEEPEAKRSKREQNLISSGKKSICPHCGQIYVTTYLKNHMQNVHGVTENDNYSSESEDTYVKRKSKAKRRKKQQKISLKEEKSMICAYCGQTYGVKYIRTHIRNVHSSSLGVKETIIQCSVCKKNFKNKSSLRCHKRKHRDLFYDCKLCDKKFKNSTTRRDHMASAHDCPYRFKCNLCDYKTNIINLFTIHNRRHTGELPFKCIECQKQFIDNRQLKLHIATHSNEKNFLCEYCHKAFATASNLKRHLNYHTQERNYVCPVESCGKSFVQDHLLKSHMKANHREFEIPPSIKYKGNVKN